MNKITQGWLDFVADVLSPHGRVIYVALKGSRLNGVDGPTSDVDLRCVYLAPTVKFMGLERPKETIEVSQRVDGLDIDFVAYEVGRFMKLLLAHNGNMIESLNVPKGYYWASDEGLALREKVGERYVTKRLYKFYRGYAQSQLKRASKQVKTGKGLIAT